jgi:hypothetical protein
MSYSKKDLLSMVLSSVNQQASLKSSNYVSHGFYVSDCSDVRDNFYSSVPGNTSLSLTDSTYTATVYGSNNYITTLGNGSRVQYMNVAPLVTIINEIFYALNYVHSIPYINNRNYYAITNNTFSSSITTVPLLYAISTATEYATFINSITQYNIVTTDINALNLSLFVYLKRISTQPYTGNLLNASKINSNDQTVQKLLANLNDAMIKY